MVVTICNDISKTDTDLYNRVAEGFETKIVSWHPGVWAEVDGDVIYCHDITLLDGILGYPYNKLPVVCFGERWNGAGCLGQNVPDFKKLFVSDNLDEIRYIIKQLESGNEC